ncbi:YeeE/YedE family protein [Polynucleobacter sp. CS-Odin-A6]|uniref:YeeE/YedE family protein n=1 Tax=Polynucleobacter sp. CS-Odin-A6 TaxID=2689106 RepID=UPI001C0C6687|nr:YeeE/YedE thiosulfate transporter family protein [Polynucleobacter sp. CS-Odin-A6]MBU3621663.1 YeeE/YedE family protein [Polynucleobacter sp. CS-Odin-A6]
MQINWIAFTPGPALLGGIILGIASSLFILLHGRILGISGIIAGLLSPRFGDVHWRLILLLGMLSAPFWAAILFDFHTEVVIDADWFAIILAGVLVGFGANYGSGCTSGHGICGLSRLSPRSLVATFTFMAAGFFTVFVIRHVLGF